MREQFHRAVLTAVGGEGFDDEAVRLGVNSMLRGPLKDHEGEYTPEDVEAAARRVRRIAASDDPQEAGEAVVGPGAAGEVLSDRLAQAAEPYIREIRRSVCGSVEPRWTPDDYESTVSWLVEQATRPEEDPADIQRSRELLGDARRLAEEAAQIRGLRATGPGLEALLVPYQPPGSEWASNLSVRANSKLAPLADAVAAVAKATGFPAHAVTTWVLTGLRPRLPRVALRVSAHTTSKLGHGADPLYRESVTLTFTGPIPEAEMRRVWRRLRRMWDAPSALSAAFETPTAPRGRGKVTTVLDLHLNEIVDALPDATWPERRELWELTPPDGWTEAEWSRSKHSRPQADTLRRRWKRLEAKTPLEA